MSQAPRKFLNKAHPPHVATLILLASMSALVMNMFLPSLPSMTDYFQTDYRIMQLSVAINLAVNGVLQLFIGPLADRYGRRPVIQAGILIFLAATLGCLYANNIWVFLICRAFQAFVATAMVLSRAIVRDMYPQEQAASMLGYITMGMSISPMIAPAVGGFLDETYGWHATFWTLFGLGILVILLVWADLGETAPSKGMRLREQVHQYPMLLTSHRFWGYTLTNAFCSGAFFAYLGGAPFVGTVIFGLSPSELGLHFAVPSVGYFCGNFISGRYSVRIGIQRMVFLGAVIGSASVMLNLGFALWGTTSAKLFFGLMIGVGLGNGMVIPNATAGALSVHPRLAGTASGLGGAIMIGGGATLSAFAGSVLRPETGALPLLWIMMATCVMSLLSILMVVSREVQIGGSPPSQT